MLALLLSSAAARARSPETVENGNSRTPEQTEVVVTGTRTPEQSQRATIKTDVVTREEAERRQATNVAEALSTQPGVQVNPGAYGYLGNLSPIQIQGFDLGRVLILEDGEPVIGDIGGAIDLAGIPINDVERIELVTGPSSALYGSSAIGGVVNVISGPPKPEGGSGRARAEYRSYHGLVLQGSGAYRRQRSFVQLDLSRARQDGIASVPGLPDLQIPESARSLIGVRVGTSLSRNIDVQLRGRFLRQRFGGLESHDVPGLGRYSADLPQTRDRYALHFQEQIRFPFGSSLRLSLARQWVRSNSGNQPQNSPLGEQQMSSQGLHSFEATGTLADGPRTWVLGSRFEAQSLSQELRRTERASGELVQRRTTEVVPQGLNSAALYGQLAWHFWSVFTVLPGLRGEYHGRHGSVIAPRIALAVRPSESLTLRAGAGRGFRSPSAEELGFNFDHSVYGYKVVGNASLVPERSWGVNGDAVFRVAPFLDLHGGLFANWVDDLIDYDLANGRRDGSVVSYSYRNFERVMTAGSNLAAVFQHRDRYRVDVAYDYLYTRDVSSNQPLAGRPPHTLTASLRLSLPASFELYARTRSASDAFVDATARTPGYGTVDMRVACTLWPSAQAYLGVLNLFDVRQDPTRVGDLRPPLGRVLYAGLRAALPEDAE